MEKRKLYLNKIISCLVLFTLASCATSTKPKINKLPPSSQVSATLKETGYLGLKRKIAIARFTNETSHGSSMLFGSGTKDRIGKQAMDILSSRLASTGKFLMIERANLAFIKKEQEDFKVKSNLIGADQLIVGSISEFGRNTVSEVGVFSRNKKQKVYARVNVRLIDVKTGQILFSQEGEGEALSEASTVFGVGARAGYDASLDDKAISAAISKLVSNLIENLMDRAWESKIIGQEGPYYIIAGGKSQSMKKGMLFSLIKPGKKVKNPQTGITINLPGKEVGKLKVVKFLGKAKDEVSLCTLQGGKKVKSWKRLIVREVSHDQ